ALRAEVLVVQVVWASIASCPVIVVTGQNTIDNLGLVQNLLSFGSDLKFFASIVFIIGFTNPVFDDGVRARVVCKLARIRVISSPLRSISVGLLPDFAFFFGLVFYRAFHNVLGVSVVRDGKVIVIRVCKTIFDGVRDVICKWVIA